MKKKYLFSILASIIMMFSICMNVSVKTPLPLQANAVTDVSNLNPVDSTYAFIKSVEGYSPECFWDVSQWTIGYGNKCPYTHTSNGVRGQKGGHTISEAEARSLFSSKLSGYVNILKSNCSGLSMTQNQFDALLSATYNHGNVLAGGCKSCGYKKMPLVQYLKGEISKSQAIENYYVWCINAGTADEKGLRNRRKKEADLFFSGVSNSSCNCSESYAGTYIVSTNSSNLVMRSEHSTNGSVITSIPKGTEVTVTKADGNWAHVNWNGNSGYCSMSYLTKKENPNPPKIELTSPNPIISTINSTTLKLNWTASSNATSYRIDRRKSGADAYETIATTSDTTYTDTGLEENTKYWYRVYAVSGSDRSSEKNSVSGTTYILTSPTPTISTLSSSSLKLTWTADTNATSYRIDRRKSGADAYETIATTSDTTYTDTGLEANTKYWYRVYSVADYRSSEKNSVSGTTDSISTNCNIKLYDEGHCIANIQVKSGTKLDEFLLPTMSQNGYEFEGWYTSETGGIKYSIGSVVPDSTELNLYARWTKSEIKGDINDDSKLNVSDVVLLQKWLLGVPDTKINNWKSADLYEDGRLDAFDMIEMRKLIINSLSA
ncbi:MAG: fibronectin type III domain-containing protein [Ruminococcus sp.]|nr:fibronectin type III domain-containing protein [Ruminococcus sp.]